MNFWEILQYSTKINKFSGKRPGWFSILEKNPTLGSILAVDQKAVMPSAVCQARRHKKTLPYPMLGGSRNPQPAGTGEEGAMARAAPGTSRGVRAPGPLREALLLPPKLAHVRKVRFRDSLLFLSRDQRFFSSLDTWLALIWLSFWKTVKSPDFQTSKFNRSSVLQSRWVKLQRIIHSP